MLKKICKYLFVFALGTISSLLATILYSNTSLKDIEFNKLPWIFAIILLFNLIIGHQLFTIFRRKNIAYYEKILLKITLITFFIFFFFVLLDLIFDFSCIVDYSYSIEDGNYSIILTENYRIPLIILILSIIIIDLIFLIIISNLFFKRRYLKLLNRYKIKYKKYRELV